jgi:hypothetical protein
MVLIFSIGAALTNVFGRMVGKERQGWAIFAVMGILFLAGMFTVYATESGGNPAFASLPRADRSTYPTSSARPFKGLRRSCKTTKSKSISNQICRWSRPIWC